MSHMPAGQYISGDSAIHKLDSRIKIISFFLILTNVIAASALWGYLFAIAVTGLIVAAARLPLKTILYSIHRLWLFFFIIFLMNALFFNSTTPIWFWGIFCVSSEGIRQGAGIVLNVFLVMILGNILTRTTSPMEITSGLNSLLKPLKLLRIPVEEAAMILGAALQFIPTLLEEADMIKKAQTARGARFESKNPVEKAASFLPLIIPIFLSSFRRADELSLAMEARGYQNAHSRTKKQGRPLSRPDIAALCISVTLCLIQLCFFT